MNNIDSVFTGTLLITAVALIAMALTVGFWAIQFFAANHTQRTSQHVSLGRWYGPMLTGHQSDHALAA